MAVLDVGRRRKHKDELETAAATATTYAAPAASPRLRVLCATKFDLRKSSRE